MEKDFTGSIFKRVLYIYDEIYILWYTFSAHNRYTKLKHKETILMQLDQFQNSALMYGNYPLPFWREFSISISSIYQLMLSLYKCYMGTNRSKLLS